MIKDKGLAFAIEKVYKQCSFKLTDFEEAKESKEYDACTFLLNDKAVIYRKAKITPTKIGQFVSIWKRNELGITAPHHANDNFDLMIISVNDGNFFGQFIFSKKALFENNIISSAYKEGKQGFRVYPLWDIAVNNQAIKTLETSIIQDLQRGGDINNISIY